jgi:hypothetical protein
VGVCGWVGSSLHIDLLGHIGSVWSVTAMTERDEGL